MEETKYGLTGNDTDLSCTETHRTVLCAEASGDHALPVDFSQEEQNMLLVGTKSTSAYVCCRYVTFLCVKYLSSHILPFFYL